MNGTNSRSPSNYLKHRTTPNLRTIMPFNLVSAWNKRRRSKSHDHTDPCMFFFFFSFSATLFCRVVVTNFSHLSGIYKPVEYWQLDDQAPQPPKRHHHGSSIFTLKEMEEATCSFSEENLLGKGGFGRVYRGTLRSGEVNFVL